MVLSLLILVLKICCYVYTCIQKHFSYSLSISDCVWLQNLKKVLIRAKQNIFEKLQSGSQKTQNFYADFKIVDSIAKKFLYKNVKTNNEKISIFYFTHDNKISKIMTFLD
jgi:hypothetical protein